MRYYGFGNYYLSSIQQGIQAAHVISDMFVKYLHLKSLHAEQSILTEWAENHKTIVLLNGGNAEQINSLYSKLSSIATQLFLPVCFFKEDQESLNNCITSVGIIVPSKYYEYNATLHKNKEKEFYSMLSEKDYVSFMEKGRTFLNDFSYTQVELDFIYLMRQYDLAR